MSEKEISAEVVKELSNDFYFYPEVKGKHFSGKQLKLDYIIKPKNITDWKNKNICFGLEFKDMPNIDQKGDTKNFTKWLAQCIDYSNTYWEEYGYVIILTCPGIRTSNFLGAIDGSWMLTRVMGQIGIGELKKFQQDGWSIVLHDIHRVWTQNKGVGTGGRLWNLKKKFGCR
jgi:hypothetical protein